jgi:hypothetical protein
MSTKTLYFIAVFIGSTIGSLIPNLWGAGLLSFSSVLLSGIGGTIGIAIVYQMTK